MRRVITAFACLTSLLLAGPTPAQKKTTVPATTVVQGTITVDPSCDLLGTLAYVPGRALIARIGISTEYSANGRPQATFRIDGVPTSLTSLNVEVPKANVPLIAVDFTATTSATSLPTINYPGTCTNALPRACTANSQCGDGNACTNDICLNGRCTNPTLTCSDGNINTNDSCNPAIGCVYTPNVCGDGSVAGGEPCDDGNTRSGDGCSASCQIEAGYTCTGSPSLCTSVCGDGKVGPGESCDDGNATSGDGCSGACQIESGYSCSGSPSACMPVGGFCSSASQCAQVPVSTCMQAACTGNQCGTTPLPAGTVCGFSSTNQPLTCDGVGQCR
jgi:cysteine-rich repeat protein